MSKLISRYQVKYAELVNKPLGKKDEFMTTLYTIYTLSWKNTIVINELGPTR